MRKLDISIILLLLCTILTSKCIAKEICASRNDTIFSNKKLIKKKSVANDPPIIRATGDQVYCTNQYLNIVQDVTITDSDDTSTDAIYIQISSGYVAGLDELILIGSHPTIEATWNAPTGKLTLKSPNGILVSYADFEAAIREVQFHNSSANPSGTRTFSITIGDANYLPSTQHYYQYIPSIGIKWTDAKAAAEASTYYGIRGYLATILAADEAQLVGEQAEGAGWIGGSDAETEGVWKWVTGPEAGTTMSYTFWNTGEPNNLNQEDYAHVTYNVGIKGSWNDLSNTGASSGNYQPKGYIVEYGGQSGDPTLEIAAYSTINIPKITSSTPASRCDPGPVTLQATASGGTISWYSSATGGSPIGTGNSFTTPFLNTTTTYYAEAECLNNRESVTATINLVPAITSTNTPITRCGTGDITLQATPSVGTINWYNSMTGGDLIGTGNNITLTNVNTDAIYYAEAINNGCTNGLREAIIVTIYTPPIVLDEQVSLCESSSVSLDAGLSGMSYLWSTGETTQSITVSVPGNYTVKVTSPSPQNCPATKTITVIKHESPIIKSVDVNNGKVIINLEQKEDYYEYSVDGSQFQDSETFFNVPAGLQTAYVREKNSCGSVATKTFIVLIRRTFFTPNNDQQNDLWTLDGLVNYPQAVIRIFDRYGKLLKEFQGNSPGWDGTYNGKPLPATDYWYRVKIDPSLPEESGHFSLLR